MKVPHEAFPVENKDRYQHSLGWYPYCDTCSKQGARCKDREMAERVCAAHMEAAA